MQNPHPGSPPAAAGLPASHLQFKGPWLPWTRGRLLAIVLVTAGYALAFSPLYRLGGSMSAAAAALPAIAVGWLLGMVPGVLAGLVLALGGNLLLFLVVGNGPAAAFNIGVLNMSAPLVVLLGGIFGWTSEVRARSRLLELRQAEQQEVLRRQNEYYSALHEMALALMSRAGPQELLQTIVARAGALAGTAHGYVFWRERGQPDCVMRVGVGVYSGFVGTAAKPGQGLAGTVLQTGEPLVIDDYLAWPGRLPDPSRDVLRAVVGVPMKSDDEVLGVIGLAHLEKGRKFGPEELEVLTRFAQLATLALDNAQLYASARQELGERQRAERDLRRASNLLDLVIENLPIMLFV
ncbi:MAG: GAF domain-containing protein, partial [Rudaea sp.]